MRQQVLYFTVGIFAGVLVGFMGANYLNRHEGGAPAAATATVQQSPSATLSPAEIEAQLKTADENPGDVQFQRNLGIALYGYGASKEEIQTIKEAIRLLERVERADSSDREALIALGNAHFDIGYFSRDNSRFQTARSYYERALALKGADPNVIVDIGLTYALTDPPDLPRAVESYRLALSAEPRHERTLQMLTDALLKSGKGAEASSVLGRLKEVNPSNPMVPEFQRQVSVPKGE